MDFLLCSVFAFPAFRFRLYFPFPWRFDEMKLFAAIIMLLTFSLSFVACSSPSGGNNSRESFNKGWLFARFGAMPDGSTKDEPSGLENADFSDTSWRKLDLPHDWGIEGPFRDDLPGSTGKLPWAGIGWYRKHFMVSSGEKGMHHFIDFDGAMSHAKIWLNGKYVGEWPYGYASFRLEMTPYIRFDGDNVLAVRLDNPPNSSRWYPGGGIYRNVWLVKTAPVHVAHDGIFVTTPAVTKETAQVHVSAEIENQSDLPAEVTAHAEIIDAKTSEAVASTPKVTVQVPSGRTAKAELEVAVAPPKLWDVSSPDLYVARVTLWQNGKVIEARDVTFGIRAALFTPFNGLLLNGNRVQINGVCNHHDLGPLGTAVNERALARQIELLKQMGCNAIRTSHNPPAPELLALCDRMGMLVLDEAFDCWEQGKTPNDYSTLFKEWHEKDIRAFVRRDRNHPSVIFWSAGNEVREQQNGVLVGKLREIFRSEDPTRPVTAGCDNPNAGFDGFQDSVDVFGYNYKPHLYAQFREANPQKALFGSETASCISSFGEYFCPVSNDKSQGAQNHQVSSYNLSAPPWATIPDTEWEGEDRNPFVAGEFVWTGFDYLGEPTPYGEDPTPSRSSYFGILDLCGFKKDRFSLYQARWRPDLPMAHLLPHWNWPERTGQVTPVHVYTSGDSAELFLNGRSLGGKSMKPFEYRLRWDDVRYEPGELRMVAYKEGRVWAADTIRTTGPAVALSLSVDRATIKADGRDLAYVTVTAIDSRGDRVPTADILVRLSVSGAGALAATANGDPTSHASFQSPECKTFHGQCLLIIRSMESTKGPIRITAASESLKGLSLELASE
jgi:beta-galactosidase